MHGHQRRYLTMTRRNIFNVILFFTFIFGIAGVFFRYYYGTEHINDEEREFYVYFEIQNVSQFCAESIKENDTLNIKASGTPLGIVCTNPQISEYKTRNIDPNGNLIYVQNKNKYTVAGCIKCKGTFSENGFFINGKTHIAPNQKIEITSLKTEGTIYILRVEYL